MVHDRAGQCRQDLRLQLRRQFNAARVRWAQPCNGEVNQGSEWLHQVVRQAQRVLPIVMVKTQCRMKSCSADSARHRGAHNGVSVVEHRVPAAGRGVAPEGVIGEDSSPVPHCSLGLDVRAVARPNRLAHLREASIAPGRRSQRTSLGADLAADDLSPESLARRLGERCLRAESRTDASVGRQREDQRRRAVCGVADDDGDAVGAKLRQRAHRYGGPRM